jgi:hypothetical protein
MGVDMMLSNNTIIEHLSLSTERCSIIEKCTLVFVCMITLLRSYSRNCRYNEPVSRGCCCNYMFRCVDFFQIIWIALSVSSLVYQTHDIRFDRDLFLIGFLVILFTSFVAVTLGCKSISTWLWVIITILAQANERVIGVVTSVVLVVGLIITRRNDYFADALMNVALMSMFPVIQLLAVFATPLCEPYNLWTSPMLLVYPCATGCFRSPFIQPTEPPSFFLISTAWVFSSVLLRYFLQYSTGCGGAGYHRHVSSDDNANDARTQTSVSPSPPTVTAIETSINQSNENEMSTIRIN